MKKLFTIKSFLSVLFCLLMAGTENIFAVGDAGVQSILTPVSPVCKGTSTVSVIIHNFGAITISTADINWKVNGSSQTTYSYVGSITAGSQDTVTLGTYNFTSGTYSLVAYTDLPNGSADSNDANDTATASITVSSKLTGTYTIAGASPDFPNFNAAVSALVANGICGPVVFNIRPDTDTMQCTIPPIAGADTFNTILFQSSTGDSTSVILTYPSQDTLINNYLILLDGADFITFKSLTLQRTGILANGRVIEFTNEATHNTVTHCRLMGAVGTTINSLAALLYSSGVSPTNDSMNTFSHNYLKDGSLGIYMNGISTLDLESYTTIQFNVFTDQYSKGIQMSNEGFALIEGNTFITNSNYAGYAAIYLDRSNRPHSIIKNKILAVPGSGMYFTDCTAQSGVHGIIANNFIQCNDSAGISMINGDYQDIAYNSILMTGTDTSFSALFMRGSGFGKQVINNILANTGGGYSYVVSDSAVFGIQYSNHNNLYHTGSFAGQYNGVPKATVANWISASQKDSNSVNINPSFVSASDLHVSSIAMDDLGQPLINVLDDIDGQPRAAVTPDIGADEYTSFSRSVGIVGFITPVDSTCGQDSTKIIVIVSNTGGNPETNFPITAKITGSLVTTLNYTYSSTISPGSSDTITFANTINTLAGGVYHIKCYTGLAVDDVHSNDTLNLTFHLFAPPTAPVTTNASICGPGTDTLNATSSDTIRWYSASTGGVLLATGPTYIPAAVNTTTTFYVSAKSACEGPRSPVTLTILPVPSVSLGNDTSILQGDSVLVNAGNGFATYQWAPGGQTTSSIYVKSTGCYTVTVTNGPGCTASDTLCVTVLSPFDVGVTSVSSPANHDCANDSIQVLIHVANLGSNSASNFPVTVNITGGVTATFTDSITASIPAGTDVVLNMGTINLTSGGFIVVKAYTGFTNDLDHTNDTIVRNDTLIVQPALPVVISGSRCGQGNVVLISFSPDSAYWYDAPVGGNLLFVGDNYVIHGLATTTTFYVQDGDFCNNEDRAPVTATINSLPNVYLGPDATAPDSLVLDAGVWSSYEWSNLSTTQTITVYTTGTYSVCVVDSNGCQNCDTIDIGIFLGVEQLTSGSQANIYPNPAHSSVTIEMNNNYSGEISIVITDMEGQTVYREEGKDFMKRTLNVSSFSKGVYYMQVRSDSGSSVYRLIVE